MCIRDRGDFFVESPIILLASIIWYLRIYQGGKYCTFPHAIELLNKKMCIRDRPVCTVSGIQPERLPHEQQRSRHDETDT